MAEEIRSDRPHELKSLYDQWWCFLLLGIALIVMGAVAIGYPLITSVAVTVMLGFLLLAGGISQIISSFWAGKWSGTLLHLLIGLLYIVIGFMVVDTPVESTAILTQLLAIFLIVGGVFRIVASLVERFTDWGWVLLSGGVALILGLLIHRQGPLFAMPIIGLFVGLEMIFNGWGWTMLAFGLRRHGAAS